MALYTRWVSVVDSATGSDVTASGSSASTKDTNASSTLVVTNAAGGSTVTKGDASAFSGPPVAGTDTLQFKDNSAGTENVYHITSVSGDNKTLTLIEAPASATADAADVWAVGGYFASIGRAATLVKPSNTNAGNDDHVYVKAASGYSGTAKITFSNAGSRSRCLVFEGYTTTAGDGGQATYDITGTAVKCFEPNANDQVFRNFKLTDSGNVTNMVSLGPSGGRGFGENLWLVPTGTSAVGLNATVNFYASRLRVASAPSTGAVNNQSNILTLFSIVHDGNTNGYRDGMCTGTYFCIADTNGVTTAGGGFAPVGIASIKLLFCTSYNEGTSGDGLRITDSASNTQAVILGNILANNAAYGLNRQGITTALPLFIEAYNDFYSNGTAPRLNTEDATGYDAAPTDVTSDPTFTDAANQNFLPTGAIRKRLAFQVGGTTYFNLGAVQRWDGQAPTYLVGVG